MTGYPLEIRVIDIMGRGVYPLGLKVGDCFASDKELAQACHWAAHVLLPFTTALRFGGQVPWEDEPDLARVCCLDITTRWSLRQDGSNPMKAETPGVSEKVFEI